MAVAFDTGIEHSGLLASSSREQSLYSRDGGSHHPFDGRNYEKARWAFSLNE